MADPTIVLASLDDEKLKQSIANLVAHVKRATHTMLTDTNSTVDAMEKKLKSLGKLKIDSGGSADGGASKRTSKLKEEETQTKANTQAIKENTAAKKENLTFDQRQKGLQTAMGVKSARDSYIAFMQGYKEQANQLTQLIQNEENRLVQAQQSRVTALGQQIDQNKTKIQELREQMQQLAQEEKNAPSRYGVKDAYRTAIQQTNDEINKLIAKNSIFRYCLRLFNLCSRRYFSFVAIPPRICLSALFFSRTLLHCLYNSLFIFTSLSWTSLCTVDFDTLKTFAAARTVALLSIM